MKSKITVILAMLLLITLSGCNNTPQTEKTLEPYSFSESSEQTSESDTLPAEKETSEVEPTPEPSQSTEPAETQSTAEIRSTESSNPKVPEQTAKPTSTPQDEPPQKTKSETVQAATPETETTPPTPPAQTETPPEPKSIYDFEFDIAAIRAELISVGEGMGLTHTDSLTPDTASWATPITASADFQGENLKRRLTDYVQSMPGLITAYGGDPIQYFTIYAEPLGGGSYRIYFLY